VKHIFSISFVVPDCTNADPHKAWAKEKDKIMLALRKRLYELTDDEGEYTASIDHLVSYED
jgi:hypothetical protein